MYSVIRRSNEGVESLNTQKQQRWNEVTPSSFSHERDGLELLRAAVPDAPPYRVWTNFEVTKQDGGSFEVDALVIGRRRIHLVELKHYSGMVHGDDQRWWQKKLSGETRSMRHPNRLAAQKARILKSRIIEVLPQVKQVCEEAGFSIPTDYLRAPWVQECTVLTNPNVLAEFTPLGERNVFGTNGSLADVTVRLTEEPDETAYIDERFSQFLSLAIDKIAGYIPGDGKRAFGQWIVDEEDDRVDPFVYYHGHKKDNPEISVSLRALPTRSLNQAERKRRAKLHQREYKFMSALQHPHLDTPIDAFQDDGGSAALVMAYPRGKGSWVPLDLLPSPLTLTAEQQVSLITQIADGIAYAHQNDITHRDLSPTAVLVDASELKHGRISAKVSRWTELGLIGVEQTQQTQLTALAKSTATAQDDDFPEFRPPEGFQSDADKRLGDLYSVAAMAFYIFAGGNRPAENLPELRLKLHKHGGLDLAASGVDVEDAVRKLIKGATSPRPAERAEAVRPPHSTAKVLNPVRSFAQRLQDATKERKQDEGDILHPAIDSLIADRFKVKKVLDSGSTARGVLVDDLDAESPSGGLGRVGAERVLKVALDPSKESRLDQEAATIKELHQKLGSTPCARRFVQLVDGPLRLPHERYVLVLSNAGENSLAGRLHFGAFHPRDFWRLGTQLLEIVEALEPTGIYHRDIKPANLGLRGKPSEMQLTLYDFSLSREPLDAQETGTVPYSDPFLGATGSHRLRFDGFAERYSAVVVLYQMATLETPKYSEDSTSPDFTDGHVLLDPGAFEQLGVHSGQRDALLEFFRRNLDKDTSLRAASAADLRQQFLAAKDAKAQDSEGADRAIRPKPVPNPAPPATPENPAPIETLEDLLDALKLNAGKKDASLRKYVTKILGTAETSPADPFATNGEYAKLLLFTASRVSQLSSEVPKLWSKQPSLKQVFRDLVAEINDMLTELGGLATPDQLTEAVHRVAPPRSEDAHRALLGVLRLVQLTVSRDPEAKKVFEVIRRGRSQTVVALANTNSLSDLPEALLEKALHAVDNAPTGIVGARQLTDTLAEKAATIMGVSAQDMPLTGDVLREVATKAAPQLALTESADLYRTDISVERMLQSVFPRTADQLTRGYLQGLIDTRFPRAEHKELPKHPELDDLLFKIDPELVYIAKGSKYVRHNEQGPDVPTWHATSTEVSRIEASLYDELTSALAPTVSGHDFRVITTAVGQATKTADAVRDAFDARVVSVQDAIFDKLQEMAGSPEAFDQILNSDVPGRRDQLSTVVKHLAKTAVDEAIAGSHGPVVLTNVSLLGTYDALGVLDGYADITRQSGAPAVWMIVPQEENAPVNGIEIEGSTFKLTSPNQIIKV